MKEDTRRSLTSLGAPRNRALIKGLSFAGSNKPEDRGES